MTKKFLIVSLLFIFFLTSRANAVILELTDTDFLNGVFSRTTATDIQSGNLTLSLGPDAKYYLNGYFISDIFDMGNIVQWEHASWQQDINDSMHNVTLAFRFSNDTVHWTQWTESTNNENTLIPALSRYIQYRINLSTSDNTTTPVVEDVSMFYDIMRPTVALEYPPNGYISYNGNVNFTCSANDSTGIENITFYWNYTGTWEPAIYRDVSGNFYTLTFNATNLSEGIYKWTCRAVNSFSVDNWGLNRIFIVNRSVVRINISVSEYITEGSDIQIFVNASSFYPIENVWANIILPNGSIEHIALENGILYNYTTDLPGRYNITCFANDTMGNIGSVTASVLSVPLVTFHIRPIAPMVPVTSVKTIFYFSETGTKAYEYNVVTDTEFPVDIMDTIYDIEFRPFYGKFRVKLNKINASIDANNTIIFDKIENDTQFVIIYAVDTNYSYNSVEVTIFYNASKFINDTYLGVYKCISWDMQSRTCNVPWMKISPEINMEEGRITIFSMGLSAFGLKQEPFCGDGICSPSENSISCFKDCECTTGETRTCGNSSVGICKLGIQRCINGKWGPCSGNIEPQEEVCNGKDDNCDGIIDNIENGTSIEDTRCGCFNNGVPKTEECNNIDDDCNGFVDDGVERICGTNRGICEFGRSICVDGRWGECIGDIKPGIEQCGNGLDDDCDGEVDENCPNCTNGIMDGDEEGIDCGGSCPNKCPEIPWMFISLIGIAGLVIVYMYERGKKKKESMWKMLEEKYMAEY